MRLLFTKIALVLVCAPLAFWGGTYIFANAYNPTAVWAVFSCKEPVSLVVVDKKNKLEIISVDNAAALNAAVDKLKDIPADRSYFINVEKHCSYNRRNT
jgi:hypothetical protein